MTFRLDRIPDQPVSTTELRSVLTEDLAQSWLQVKREDTQFHRRVYVRAAFAFLDGFVAVMKSGALAEFKAGRCSISPGELTMLLEETYSVADNGEVRSRGAYVPTTNGIRFAFHIFARAHCVSLQPDYADSRWRSLSQAVDVRNRLTHPKASADLTVTDAELVLIDHAWSWFLEASFLVYVEGRAALVAKLTGLGMVLAPERSR